jgi:hypothetical protein
MNQLIYIYIYISMKYRRDGKEETRDVDYTNQPMQQSPAKNSRRIIYPPRLVKNRQ